MDRSIATRPTLDQWIRHHLAARALSRRTLLGGIGGLTGLTLLGCSSGGSGGTTGTSSTTSTTSTTTTTATTTTTPGSCVLIPEETVGPYPLFNDIASAAAYQRADITEGKTGVPLNLILNIVNEQPVRADPDGDGVRLALRHGRLLLRLQPERRRLTRPDVLARRADNGYERARHVQYDYPGWYPGRATHIHFRVYLGLALQATSQLAFPSATTGAVYSTPLYVAKGQNPMTPSGSPTESAINCRS